MSSQKKKPVIFWSKSIWFFDIDDTLIDTAGASIAASEGIWKIFVQKYGKTEALAIQNHFNTIFKLMLTGHQLQGRSWKSQNNFNDYQNLLKQIKGCQKKVIARYGAKLWSREVFIKLACDKINLEVKPEIVHKAAHNYWLTLAAQTPVFPDALTLIQEIKKRKRPVVLITGSDARLTMNKQGQFNYNPRYSERLKLQRVQILKNKGIDYDAVSIGDPEDKPTREFFEKGIRAGEKKLGHKIDLKNAIIIGDSYDADLKTPKKMSFGLVVLFQTGEKSLKINDPHQITTGNLLDLISLLGD